jgi:hypothetical protein
MGASENSRRKSTIIIKFLAPAAEIEYLTIDRRLGANPQPLIETNQMHQSTGDCSREHTAAMRDCAPISPGTQTRWRGDVCTKGSQRVHRYFGRFYPQRYHSEGTQ